MKIIIIILMLSSTFSFAQKIVTNEIDEFNGNVLKVSSWEKLAYSGEMNSFVRLKKINSTFILSFKFITTDKTYSIDEGDVLYLKFENTEVLKLRNNNFEVSSIGGGSIGIGGSNLFGIQINCSVNLEDLTKLKSNKLIKMRIYQSNGYCEEDVKKKRALKFISLLSLFDL